MSDVTENVRSKAVTVVDNASGDGSAELIERAPNAFVSTIRDRTLFRNDAAADGWLARSRSLIGSDSPVAGWVAENLAVEDLDRRGEVPAVAEVRQFEFQLRVPGLERLVIVVAAGDGGAQLRAPGCRASTCLRSLGVRPSSWCSPSAQRRMAVCMTWQRAQASGSSRT